MDVKIYDKLAKKYDLATKIVSFGIEEIWRWIFVRHVKKFVKKGSLIDIASATGEMAKALNFNEMYLIEPSSEMNKIAMKKFNGNWIKKDNRYIFEDKIVIIEDTAENFKIDEKADLITAFMAVRNFDDIKKGIKNLDNHLKSGGYFAIVEMVKSDSFISKIIMWYMNNIVPLIAGLLTNMKEEYKLLGKSIDKLKEEDILNNLDNYDILVKKRLLFIATLIIAKKR
jgi:ubiquinone/menaquinone biosynthesis C-methylase UbiE